MGRGLYGETVLLTEQGSKLTQTRNKMMRACEEIVASVMGVSSWMVITAWSRESVIGSCDSLTTTIVGGDYGVRICGTMRLEMRLEMALIKPQAWTSIKPQARTSAAIGDNNPGLTLTLIGDNNPGLPVAMMDH